MWTRGRAITSQSSTSSSCTRKREHHRRQTYSRIYQLSTKLTENNFFYRQSPNQKNTKRNENPALNLSTAPLHIWKSTMRRVTKNLALGRYVVWAYQKIQRTMKKPTIAKKQEEEPKEKKSPSLHFKSSKEKERKNTSKTDINHSRIRQMSPNWKKRRPPPNYLQIQNDRKK